MATETSHSEPLINTVTDYLPQREILCAYPTPGPIELKAKEEYERRLPGVNIIVRKHAGSDKIIMGPGWHPALRSALDIDNAGLHYSQGVFEGCGLRPVIDDNGEVVGANLVLHEQRMARYKRSLQVMGLSGFVDDRTLRNHSQALIDLASMSSHVFFDKDGKPTMRGYIRPAACRVSGIGTGIRATDGLEMTIDISSMGQYLDASAYSNGADVAVFMETRRFNPINAKAFGGYGSAGALGRRARELGNHEVGFFGPYWVDPKTDEPTPFHPTNKAAVAEQIIRNGVMADAGGEDYLFITDKGEILYQPMNTNILGGTTRQYIIDHMAPFLRIPTTEKVVSLNDLRSHKVVSALFVGNAVGVCPIRQFNIYDGENNLVDAVPLEVCATAEKLTQRMALELSGRKDMKTSGPLLTPVDLKEGEEAAQKLKEKFASWL